MLSLPSLLLALLATTFVTCVSALSASGNRLLVVLDDVADKTGYSQFFGDLEERGFTIAYETPKSDSLALFKHGERTYDHLLLFPSKAKALGANLTPSILLQFVNAQGNVLVALSSAVTVSSSVVNFLSELDIILPSDRTGLVVDHFSYDAASAADKHDVLLLAPPKPVRSGSKSLFTSSSHDPIAVPRALGHVLGAGPLLTPILRAPRTAYNYNPKENTAGVDPEDLFAAGEQLGLVSAAQARNSARVAVVGSVDMLNNEWFEKKVQAATGSGAKTRTWNREFAKRISGWAFYETGVLRVNSIQHQLDEAGSSNETNPSIYKVKNNVKYSISLSEYSWDRWTPFTVPKDDALQLEFSMLSPFVRLPLHPEPIEDGADEATYSASFVLPDQHGIFNFLVNYKRPLLTSVEEKRTVSVRHVAHDEWPRSFVISGAWPWISGIFVTVAGFVAFCAVWMYSQPVAGQTAGGKAKKTQ